MCNVYIDFISRVEIFDVTEYILYEQREKRVPASINCQLGL